ncbi:MAG: integration host factor subunit beta [Dysgonamonadaceae bacterium]|jgi:DNA-binding protein HU-beta|nr:integration host factor subunit beta [Dysgonamonadaceae bacterium]
MTKAEIVSTIAKSSGLDRATVLTVVEGFIETVTGSMIEGNNVYLRGFGSFVVKKRAAKAARHIKQNKTIIIPERSVPTFKPSHYFSEALTQNLDKTKK